MTVSYDNFMSLKLDISKTYDSVNWSFSEATMYKLGFKEYWIKKLIMCVKSISFSILINGEPKGMIVAFRGF